MKKKLFAIALAVAFVFAAAGCGNSEEQPAAASEPEQKICKKELSPEAAHALDMAGISDSNSTGMLQYQGDDQVKSVTFKLMEYRADKGKWSCINKYKLRAGESGDILVNFSEDYMMIHMAVTISGSGPAAQSEWGIKPLPNVSEDETITDEQIISSPLERDKDIALHMTYTEAADGGKSPDLAAYPDTSKYKDYKYIRAIVANFSSEPAE